MNGLGVKYLIFGYKNWRKLFYINDIIYKLRIILIIMVVIYMLYNMVIELEINLIFLNKMYRNVLN